MSDTPKGPASYFASIEKMYGMPIVHWLEIAHDLDGMKHRQRVERLKAEHGLNHRHANAIVAHVLAEQK